ncbi:MAG TPA: MCE family protein [Acidimicrobiales bacterium]|nr:MCE family protein [Acidimicrobiales bacterium]
MSRRARTVALVLATAAVGAGLAGCGLGGSPPAVTVKAVFSDVEDLNNGAQVQMADVPVGHVTAIDLDGDRAEVTMALDQGAHVPADVTAELDQTTVLGEYYVNLVPPRGAANGEPLANGATIARTSVVPGVEQVIGAGAQVFGSVSTSQLAQIVAAGGQGFDGQAASLRQLLDALSSVTAGYASRTGQITTVVDSLDQLGSSLAPNAGADAQAITNLSNTVSVLATQADRFDSLLQSLDDVSTQGHGLLATYFPQITDQLQALDAVAHQVAVHQQDLAQLLEYLPLHDATMSTVARQDYLQVLNNLIVCGIPDGGSDTTAAFTCARNGSSGVAAGGGGGQ